MSKRICVSCPICDAVISQDDASSHVNQHFGDIENGIDCTEEAGPSVVQCCYTGSSAKIQNKELSDHLLAHAVGGEEESLPSQGHNDSALARLMQEEENNLIVFQPQTSYEEKDRVIAEQIHLEDLKKREEEEFTKLQEMYGMVGNGGYKRQFEDNMDRKVGKTVTVADYYAQKANLISSGFTGHDSGETRTTGVIEVLSRYISQSSSSFKTCVPVDHFSAGFGDSGWGCGYRNLQMILSALLLVPNFKTVISKHDLHSVPSVPKLQELIENAWKLGYDTSGCKQLDGKLRNTRKWIGTTEVVALLRSHQIRARIVDFHKPTSTDGTHPKLFQWAKDYFNERCLPSGKPPAFPLYLQHQGHSRLCIGVEESQKGEIYLLLFDPSHKPKTMSTLMSHMTEGKQKDPLKVLRKSMQQMKFKQFQVIFIDGIYEDISEIKASKEIQSIRIP